MILVIKNVQVLSAGKTGRLCCKPRMAEYLSYTLDSNLENVIARKICKLF